MEQKFSNEELDTIIREVIGAERKVLFESGNSPSKRLKEVKGIIDRRITQGSANDT